MVQAFQEQNQRMSQGKGGGNSWESALAAVVVVAAVAERLPKASIAGDQHMVVVVVGVLHMGLASLERQIRGYN